MKNFLAALLPALLLGSVALADRVDDGDYTYNDTTGGGVDAVVSNGGNYMEIGNTSYFYNATSDSYVSDPAGVAISLTDQGYRYAGVNSSTGVCTLYPKGPKPSPNPFPF